MTKLAVFSHQNLMIAINSFSLLCTIVRTIHSSYILCTISLCSQNCRNRWSILCLNSKKKTKTKKTNKNLPPARPHFQICVEGKQTIVFLSYMFVRNIFLAKLFVWRNNHPICMTFRYSPKVA